jgi:hypothetical protein
MVACGSRRGLLQQLAHLVDGLDDLRQFLQFAVLARDGTEFRVRLCQHLLTHLDIAQGLHGLHPFFSAVFQF